MVGIEILIGKWKAPTVWDRVKQDEPLDPVEGTIEGVGFTSPTYTITTVTGTNYTTPTQLTGSTHGGVIIIDSLTRGIHDHTWSGQGMDQGTGSGFANNRDPLEHQTTAFPYGNPLPQLPQGFPRPRNARERKILKVIGDKLPEMIKRASAVIGPPGSSEQWNHRFFEFVSRQPGRSVAVERRRAR
jgi:hypothetical protein